MGKRAERDKQTRQQEEHASCSPGAVSSRLNSSLSFIPARKARWGLVVYGLVFLAQGIGKALEPTGYMTALEAFHVLKPAALGPLSLGALALIWTVLELLAGVAMLYGGLSRTPAKQLTLGGIMLALGLSCAYLSLDVGAFARQLPIENCTCFGAYLPQKLSWFVLAQEILVIALLTWLFTSVTRWPSLEHAGNPPHRRSPFAAWFTAP